MHGKIDTMSIFAKEYKRLNSAQKQAVDTIDGPLLVLAGPGTGKTQLLSARVANILTKTDTDPANIVCLTFTVNAANNMRERLRSMIGPNANQVVIKTFHSLAADIISSYPEHFYAGAVLNPMSDLAAQEIMLSIFDKLPHDNPLASMYNDKYTHLGNALQAIGRAKDAGLSPDKLRTAVLAHHQELDAIEPAIIDLFAKPLSHKSLESLGANMADLVQAQATPLAESIARLLDDAINSDLPTGKTTHTGILKKKLLSNIDGQKIMVRERKANAWWQALIDVYEAYQAVLYKRGYMDYSDMLISVIEALEKDENLRLDLQETVHYLLVDEFQDSNEAQIKLMHLLIDNTHIETPNVMVVGDPNQTIYGFNGAMLDNTTDFQMFYNDRLTTVGLTENYRSSQIILDDSRSVIEQYSDFRPDLLAKNEQSKIAVSYTAYATEADQAVLICKRIQDLLSVQSKDSIAVLARSHASLTYLAQHLSAENITVNYEHSIDIRTTSCNQLIITVLSLIKAVTEGDRQASNNYLATVLRHPALDIDPSVTWKLALQAKRSSVWLDLASEQPATASVANWVQHLVSVAASQQLHVVIEQLLSSEFLPGRTLYKAFYESKSAESVITEAQATRQLLALAKQYAQTEHVELDAFLTMVREATSKLFLFSPTTGHYEHAVTLMSVHGAKGLEFDHVFVLDVDETNWRPKAQRYPTPLSLPVHINLDTPADYARLLYVAMTRAKQSLYISYVKRIDSKTTALPTEQLTQVAFEEVDPVSNQKRALSEIAQLIPKQPRPKTKQELLDTKLATYSLSATHLSNFLDLSQVAMDTFIEDNLVNFPEPASDVLAHGNAMHAAMELAQIQASNKKFDLAAIKRLYVRKIADESLTTAVINRLTDRAHTQLDRLFTEFDLKLDSNSKPEQSYSATTNEGLRLYGKIDRVDTIDDRTLKIVDYKTGKPITNPKSIAQDVLLKQWRHRLQLGFYILLAKQQKSYTNKRIQACIIQLDATSPDHLYLTYEFDESDLARTEQLARAVFNRIKTLDIPNTSNFEPTLDGIKAFENDLISGF